MKDIDLIVANVTRTKINFGGLEIPRGQRKSVQVKLRTDGNQEQQVADFLITGSPKSPDQNQQNCFGREWLLAMLETHKKTNAWLKRSTKWANKFVKRHARSVY